MRLDSECIRFCKSLRRLHTDSCKGVSCNTTTCLAAAEFTTAFEESNTGASIIRMGFWAPL